MIHITKEDYATGKKIIKETKLVDGKWTEVFTGLDELVSHNDELITYRKFLELSNGDSVVYFNPLTNKSITRKEWKENGAKIEDLV